MTVKFVSITIFSLFLFVLTGCGGSGGSGSGPSNTNHDITTLAHSRGGAGFNVTISNGRAYFSDYNTGEIKSVSLDGGSITTHYNKFSSIGNVVHWENQIYALNTKTQGELLSLPDTTEDVTVLSGNQNAASATVDVLTDANYAYWSEYDRADLTSHIVRVPLVPTGLSPLNTSGASTDMLVGFTLNGIARIAIDGNNLFILEVAPGNIFKVDLATGGVTTLATAIVTSSIYPTPSPLVAAGGYLYIRSNDYSIIQVNEITGSTETVASVSYMDAIKTDGNDIYWLDVQSTGQVFRSYSSQTGLLKDIVTIPGATIIHDYCVVNGQLWFTDDSVLGSVTVKKVAVAGGAPVSVATFPEIFNGNTSSFTFPYGLVADNTDLYWLTAVGILTLSQAGGAPILVTSGLNTHSYYYDAIALTSSNIVWGGNARNGIMEISKTAEPVTPTTIYQAAFPSIPEYMTADTASLYWTTVNYNPTTSTVSSWFIPSGPVSDLGTSNGRITRIFPYQNLLFFIRQPIIGNYSISYMPAAGGAEVVLGTTSTTLGEVRDVNVINDVLYFSARNESSGSGGVYAIDLTTNNAQALVEGVSYPNRLYVDNTYVYWTTNPPGIGGGGGVYRIPLLGGPTEIIYSGQWCWDITGDDNRIYWAAGWWIFSAKK